MLSLIYKIYFIKFRHQLLDQYFYRIIVRLTNYLLPIYFRMTGWLVKNLNRNNKSSRKPVIVSLTSFPARINKVWLTIETILRQMEKPDKVLLWLYKAEFKNKKALPRNLLRLTYRGLEIRFCDENLRSHLKYYYTMLSYPDANIIVIDDDMLYPPDLIKKLKIFNVKYPEGIICPISMKIEVSNSVIKPYIDWEYVTSNTLPGFSTLLMGCGSTFYPPGSLDKEVFNKQALKEMALSADDLWLQIMSIKNNTRVVCIGGEYKRFFIPIIIKNNCNLMEINILGGQNDVILNRLINYYQIPVTIFEE